MNIISYLFDYNEFSFIKNTAEEEQIKRVLNIFIDSFPEDISLDTVLYYQILDLIKFVLNFKDNYSKNILLFARAKFKEFSLNDVYLFDFDKSIKQEVKNIFEFLNNLNLSVDDIVFEYKKPYQLNLLLNIIQEYNIEKFDNYLIDIFNKNEISCEFQARIAEILKSHNKVNLIDKNIIDKIENYNVKALILSYI